MTEAQQLTFSFVINMLNLLYNKITNVVRIQEHKFYTLGMILVGLATCLCILDEKGGHILEVS